MLKTSAAVNDVKVGILMVLLVLQFNREKNHWLRMLPILWSELLKKTATRL